MNSPPSKRSSHKRPFAAIDGVAIDGVGANTDKRSDKEDHQHFHLTSNSILSCDDTTAAPQTSDTRDSNAVDFGKVEHGFDDNSHNENEAQYQSSRCDSDNDEIMNVPDEITDLRKSLEYLVSKRNIKNIYNGNIQNLKEPTTSQSDILAARNNNSNSSNIKKKQGQETEDEQLCMIPNLINRILMEHYHSPNDQQRGLDNTMRGNKNAKDGNKASASDDGNNNNICNSKNLTRNQKEQMTQLLLAVIVEFAEPHFARMACRRRKERSRKLLLQKKQQEQQQQQLQRTQGEKKTKKDRRNKPQSSSSSQTQNALLQQDDDQSSLFEFDERATSWATSCLKRLLQPPPLAPPNALNNGNDTSSVINNDTNNWDDRRCSSMEDDDDDDDDGNYNIPELDALLAASGPRDGMEMERRMQSALVHGFQGRRIMQNMGMFGK